MPLRGSRSPANWAATVSGRFYFTNADSVVRIVGGHSGAYPADVAALQAVGASTS
jgi:hypothetical protein